MVGIVAVRVAAAVAQLALPRRLIGNTVHYVAGHRRVQHACCNRVGSVKLGIGSGNAQTNMGLLTCIWLPLNGQHPAAGYKRPSAKSWLRPTRGVPQPMHGMCGV